MAGDLKFKVNTLPHHLFRRKGNDLRMKMRLSLREALLGFSRKVEHVDGHVFTVADGGTTQHGAVRVVKGEGMPEHNYASQKGNLHVEFEVEMPPQLTDEQKKVPAHRPVMSGVPGGRLRQRTQEKRDQAA